MKSTSRRRRAKAGPAAPPDARAPRASTRSGAPRPLPASVAAAWGLKTGVSRPRPHGLSLERLVDAGIRVATAEGLPAVSMSRVAAELGAATMSLYRHVQAKDDLLAHMVDAAFAAAPPAAAPTASWRTGLDGWASAHLAVLRRHPWLVRIPISGPPSMPSQVLWFERGLGCLRATALAEAEKVSVLLLINGFVRNQATLEADLAVAARTAGLSARDVSTGYGDLLARVADPERFPAVHDLVRAKVFAGEGALADDFRFGLDRILDGVDVLIRARATAELARPRT